MNGYRLNVVIGAPALVEWTLAGALGEPEPEPVITIRLGDLVIAVDVDVAEQIADGIVEALAERDTLPVWPRS